MEQGLWRFAVQMSPLEFADLAQESVQTFLNGAQDCAIYMRNNVRGKKKKGDAKMFFPRLQAAKLAMEKVFQLVLVSKKVDLEITRKLLDSSKKDTDGSSSGDDKNVHISSVPKGTTQELLLLTFPTSHAIRMPREGSDNGSVVIEYSNANQAKDIVRSYISVSINKVKLRLTWNGLSREKLPVPPPKKVDGKVFQIPVRDGWREGKTKSQDRRESRELKELFGNAPGGAAETNTSISENEESSNIQEPSSSQGNQKVQTPPTSQESKVGDVAGRTLKSLSFSPRSGEGCHDRKQEEEGGQGVRQEGTDIVEGTEVISPDWERDHPDRESISPDWDDSPNKEDTKCQKETSQHQRLARDDIQQSRVRQRQGRHSDKDSGRTGRNAQSDKGLRKDARDLELSRRDSRRPSSDAAREALKDSYQSGKRSREEGDYSMMRSTDQRAGTSMAHRFENSVYSQRRPSPLRSTQRYIRSPRHSPKRLRRSSSPPRHRIGPHLSRSPLAKHRSSISPSRILPDQLRSVSPIRPSVGHDNRSRSPAKQRAPKTFTPERDVRDAKLLAQMLLKSLSPSRSSQPPKEKGDWNAGQQSGFQRTGWNVGNSGDQKNILSSQSTLVTRGPLFPIGLPSASHPVTAGSFIAAKGPASTSGNSSLQKIPGLDLAVAEDMRTRTQDRFLEQVQSLSRPEEKLPQFMAGGVSEGVLYGTASEAFRQKPDLQKKGTSSSFGTREEPFRPSYQPDSQKTSWANKLDAVQTWPLSDKSQITAISEPTSERTLTPKTGLSSNALAGRDLMVLRQEAARHLASLEKSAGGAKKDEGRQDLRTPLRAETSGNAVVMDYGHQSRKREAEQKPIDVPLKRIRDEGFGKDIMSVGNQDSMAGGSKNQQNLGGAWSRDDSRTGLGGIQMPWKSLVHSSEGSGLGPSPSVRDLKVLSVEDSLDKHIMYLDLGHHLCEDLMDLVFSHQGE
ncbi:uncharacterized protein LOC112576866 isoform X2 [Pomacea canaliculata]|uniref:uncharacterized protein LOC112576866 isoform X2 n=1 Tax=Pomacea canaliculata TaxID=400727 RepID=UPI000D737664|nr:uncharacterized protein LOC112576866 isoform X2 [Pomacea canaliculata]